MTPCNIQLGAAAGPHESLYCTRKLRQQQPVYCHPVSVFVQVRWLVFSFSTCENRKRKGYTQRWRRSSSTFLGRERNTLSTADDNIETTNATWIHNQLLPDKRNRSSTKQVNIKQRDMKLRRESNEIQKKRMKNSYLRGERQPLAALRCSSWR